MIVPAVFPFALPPDVAALPVAFLASGISIEGVPLRAMIEETQRDLEVGLQLQAAHSGACIGCGCTDERACPGGCTWVAPGLCSRCAGP